MRRGDIVVFAVRGPYTYKPRPGVIVQSDDFLTTESIIVTPFTTTKTDASLTRIAVPPGGGTGLSIASQLMVEKTTAIRRGDVRHVIGRLASDDLARLNRALLLVLGIA